MSSFHDAHERIRWVRVPISNSKFGQQTSLPSDANGGRATGGKGDEEEAAAVMWWPALLYDSHDELQRSLSALDRVVGARIFLEARSQRARPSSPVALLLGSTTPTGRLAHFQVDATAEESVRDFFTNYGVFFDLYSSSEHWSEAVDDAAKHLNDDIEVNPHSSDSVSKRGKQFSRGVIDPLEASTDEGTGDDETSSLSLVTQSSYTGKTEPCRKRIKENYYVACPNKSWDIDARWCDFSVQDDAPVDAIIVHPPEGDRMRRSLILESVQTNSTPASSVITVDSTVARSLTTKTGGKKCKSEQAQSHENLIKETALIGKSTADLPQGDVDVQKMSLDKTQPRSSLIQDLQWARATPTCAIIADTEEYRSAKKSRQNHHLYLDTVQTDIAVSNERGQLMKTPHEKLTNTSRKENTEENHEEENHNNRRDKNSKVADNNGRENIRSRKENDPPHPYMGRLVQILKGQNAGKAFKVIGMEARGQLLLENAGGLSLSAENWQCCLVDEVKEEELQAYTSLTGIEIQRIPMLTGYWRWFISTLTSLPDEKLLHYTKRRILFLSTSNDSDWLNELHCFFRAQCVEVFEASSYDVMVREKLKKLESNKKVPVSLGHVGLRCPFCAHRPYFNRASRSSSFPSSKTGIRDSFYCIIRNHFKNCEDVPEKVQEQYLALKNRASKLIDSGSRSHKYWVDSAEMLGIVNTPEGIQLQRQKSRRKS